MAAIQALVPSVPQDQVDENHTVSENLQLVDRLASNVEKQDFLSWLASGSDWDDEYLSGIMQER